MLRNSSSIVAPNLIFHTVLYLNLVSENFSCSDNLKTTKIVAFDEEDMAAHI